MMKKNFCAIISLFVFTAYGQTTFRVGVRTELCLKVLLFLLTLVLLPLSAQHLKTTGLVIGAGGENVNYKLPGLPSGSYDLDRTWLDSKFGMEIGYRFRIQPKQSYFFYDIDILGGYRKYDSQYYIMDKDQNPSSYGLRGETLLSASLAGTFNYKIVKGLYVGIGLQPTVYLWDISEKAFDVFAIGKLGYDFGFLDLSVSYKQGLAKKLALGWFDNCRLSGWQVSLYIPFSYHQKKK